MSSKPKFKHTSKLISALLLVALMACMMVTSMLPVFAATNAAVTEVSNSLLQLRAGYKHGDVEYWYPVGSCFLINNNTILTCEHVVAIDGAIETEFNRIEGGQYKANSVMYEVVVHKDVTVRATLKKTSVEDDYAILTLNESINRPYVTLGNSEEIIATDQVFALGFPGEITNIQNINTYTSEDVTITEGLVQKKTEYYGTEVIQHGATLTPGNSGGPLVDENGYVIGVNMGADDDGETGDKDYFFAIDIAQIKNVLDALFIEYTEAGAVTPVVTDAPVATDAPIATDAPTTTPAPPVVEPETDYTKVIIIVAIVVLVLALAAVVVVILINATKKKPAPNHPAGPNGGVMPPSAPVQRQAPPTPPYAQPYSRPSMPPQGAAPTMPSNEGAGETSVLNEGAGETTVLGGGSQATGFTLVRAKGGERININKPEFTIGKEKRRVDYCISDNNSVSRAHAKLRVRGGRCYITDLGSTNCTYVNGTKLSPNQEVILSGGDKIKISDEEFEFVG